MPIPRGNLLWILALTLLAAAGPARGDCHSASTSMQVAPLMPDLSVRPGSTLGLSGPAPLGVPAGETASECDEPVLMPLQRLNSLQNVRDDVMHGIPTPGLVGGSGQQIIRSELQIPR